MKQCYFAVFQYAGDQRMIPKNGQNSGYGGGSGPWWWVAAKGKYLVVPESNWAYTPGGIVACSAASDQPRPIGIGLLYAHCAESAHGGQYARFYFSGRIQNPSVKVLLSESAGAYANLGYYNRWIFSPGYSKTQADSNFAAVHGGKSTVAFADGAARPIRAAQYSEGASNPCVMINGTKTDEGSFNPESREPVGYIFARR